MLLVTYAREGLWLAWKVSWALAEDAYDRVVVFWAVAHHDAIPRRAEELLNPAALARLLETPTITRVEVDEGRALASARCELGAGGTGTSRTWIRAEQPDGSQVAVFVKLPASALFERIFLTVFGVYRNEVGFYAALVESAAFRATFRPGLFADAVVARTSRQRFVLVVEDLAARGPPTVAFPTVKSPHPPGRVRAVLEGLASLHAAHYGAPPRGVWTDEWSCCVVGGPETRPPFLRLIADATLRRVLRRYPGLLPPDVLRTYRRFLDHFALVRRHWSTGGPLTLVHGDAHLGNMFFENDDAGADRVGFYDLQCVAAEHPIRDVAYHLMSSVDAQDLAANERAYLAFYVDELNSKLRQKKRAPPTLLTLADAFTAYRGQALWCMAAFIISSGASDLFEESFARLTIGRIVQAAQRIRTDAALDDIIIIIEQEAGQRNESSS